MTNDEISTLSMSGTYHELIMEIPPLPEVEEAVERLLGSRWDASVSFSDEVRWETIDGEEITFLFDEDEDSAGATETTANEVSTTETTDTGGASPETVATEVTDTENNEDVEYDDDIVMRMYGMPLITLYYYQGYKDGVHIWSLSLYIEMLTIPEVQDSPSQYEQFIQSRYWELFKEWGPINGVCTMRRYMGNLMAETIRLISYYIRYYGYGKDKPFNIRFSGKEYDED